MSNSTSDCYSTRRSAVRWLAAVLAIQFLFAAGFSCAWFQLFHTRVISDLKPSSSDNDAATTATAPVRFAELSPVSSRVTTFPQFGTSGTLLTSYTPGTSLWLRTVFGLSYPGSPGGGFQPQADEQAAGVNAWEQGMYGNPTYSGCNSTNFALTGGTGACGNWHNNWETTIWTPFQNAFNTYHMPLVARTDDLFGYPNYGSDTTTWAFPAVQDYTASLNRQAVPNHMVVAQIGPDEVPNNYFTQTFENSSLWQKISGGLGLGGGGYAVQPHVIWGPEPLYASTHISDWFDNPQARDYPVLEASGANDTAGNLGGRESVDSLVANVTAVRGRLPNYIVAGCTGPAYFKKTNDTQYTPGVDTLAAEGSSPALTVDMIFHAVAHGYAGIRIYKYDWQPQVNSRTNDPICTSSDGSGCSLEETGCSPISAHTAIGSLGQDRWYALSAAYNLVKKVEPYVLQPAITAPVCTSPIVCGAKHGNGGTLVVFVNYSDNSNSVTYNPSPYIYAGGTAQSWKIISSNHRDCGAQSTLPSVNDCGIGPTQVIGATTVAMWTDGSVLPSPGTAPTTTSCGSVGGSFSNGVCTLSMQPLEVDVFLYQQKRS